MPNFSKKQLEEFERSREELNALLEPLMTEKRLRESDKLLIAQNDSWRSSISKTLKGKTLEELIGKERAEVGRKSRSAFHKGKTRPKAVGERISATRRENGSYDGRSMLGKEHKESTKEIMSQKAKVRQDLKRTLELGRSDRVPQELLDIEYKKRGWL